MPSRSHAVAVADWSPRAILLGYTALTYAISWSLWSVWRSARPGRHPQERSCSYSAGSDRLARVPSSFGQQTDPRGRGFVASSRFASRCGTTRSPCASGCPVARCRCDPRSPLRWRRDAGPASGRHRVSAFPRVRRPVLRRARGTWLARVPPTGTLGGVQSAHGWTPRWRRLGRVAPSASIYSRYHPAHAPTRPLPAPACRTLDSIDVAHEPGRRKRPTSDSLARGRQRTPELLSGRGSRGCDDTPRARTSRYDAHNCRRRPCHQCWAVAWRCPSGSLMYLSAEHDTCPYGGVERDRAGRSGVEANRAVRQPRRCPRPVCLPMGRRRERVYDGVGPQLPLPSLGTLVPPGVRSV